MKWNSCYQRLNNTKKGWANLWTRPFFVSNIMGFGEKNYNHNNEGIFVIYRSFLLYTKVL